MPLINYYSSKFYLFFKEPPNNEQPLMQLGINLKRIQLTDLLKSKVNIYIFEI
jgi:hypothetical protein